jgi:hypothetical protein
MDATSTRVNGELLERYVGKRVCIVGQVLNPGPTSVTIQTTDSKTVVVVPNPGQPPQRWPSKGWVEVTGRLQGNLEIIEDFSVPFTGQIDQEAWNEMVQIMAKHKDIF